MWENFRFLFSCEISSMGQMKRQEQREHIHREKEAGRICAQFERVLNPPQRPGQRRCALCEPRMHVQMCFERRPLYWHVSFRPGEFPLGHAPDVSIRGPGKVRDLYERFGVRHMLEDKQAFEGGVRNGKDIVELALGEEQYSILAQTKKPSPRR